jgi:perosamine synthetase
LIVPSKPMVDFRIPSPKNFQILQVAVNLYFYPRGRDALVAAMQALGIVPGNVVVVPAYICQSAVEPLKLAGYRLVFVDIKLDFQLDPDEVLRASKIHDAKAVLVVHYFGLPVDVGRLVDMLSPHGIRIVEDCCHSFLTRSGGRQVGFVGDAAVFSMRKTLPIPDGGALRLNIRDLDKAIFRFRTDEAPLVWPYLAGRLVEAVVSAVGWPNIYSSAAEQLKKLVRKRSQANNKGRSACFLPVQQTPSALLRSYLSDENYLRRVCSRTAENYYKLVKGALALGLKPYVPELPIGCVPQWMPLYDESGQIVKWLRGHGVGACHWPWHELPDEVASAASVYPKSNELNVRLALMPVHQSIRPDQIDYMLSMLGKFANLHAS